MLRVITTFNDKLYRASARSMLQSVESMIPEAEILVYHELKDETCEHPGVRVDELPEFTDVFERFRHRIADDFGGTATDLSNWNRRWFGWYRKVCAQYDALVRRPTEGLTLWFDTDIRITKMITEEFIRQQMEQPVGLFRGSRDNVEAGYIIFDEQQPQTKKFIERCMEVYTSGEFLQLEKWSDSDVLAYVMDEDPSFIQDYADNREAIRYQNSNGHETEGQIIPQSVWRDYVEHDKGLHWRTGVSALPFQNTQASAPAATPKKKLWTRIRHKVKSWFRGTPKPSETARPQLVAPDPELVQLCLNSSPKPSAPASPVVGFFVPEDNELHRSVLEAFRAGVEQNGDKTFTAPLEAGWVDCDIAVTFGIYKAQWERGKQVGTLMSAMEEKQVPHIVLERGFIQREDYFMAGIGGLNHRAEFHYEDADNQRLKLLNTQMADWKQTGERIIVCGQVPWDSSVQHISFETFIDGTIRQLSEYTDKEIVFRPHPQHPEAIAVGHLPCTLSENNTLAEDLQDAFAVVTFNSNAAVEAVIAGVPVFAFDEGSMAWPIANSDLRKINDPDMPERQNWLEQVSYAQWNLEEMSAGLPWERLRRHLTHPAAQNLPSNQPPVQQRGVA